MKNKNVLKRIAIVQKIMEEHYEPGNQRKSQIQVLRNILNKTHPMSERTMRRYMKVDVEQELEKQQCQQQMKIDFNFD